MRFCCFNTNRRGKEIWIMKKRGIAFMLSFALLTGSVLGSLPALSVAAADEDSKLITSPDIPLRLQYDEPASHGINTKFETEEGVGALGNNSAIKNALDDWQNWSIPIGNGYFGANVFGRTESERIQLSEKTLANPYGSWNTSKGGLNNFSETYIDFGHTESQVTDYYRALDLKTAVSTVDYVYGGVHYSREYFTSYPDNALVIKITADTAGALDFTLRPTVPYEQSWSDGENHDVKDTRVTKTGAVDSYIKNGVGVVELYGKLGYYDVDFLGIYHVYTDGNMTASTTQHEWTDSDGTKMSDTDGTIVVSGATTAYIYVTLGTDYEINYLNYCNDKPTYTTTLADTRVKVEGYMNSLAAKIDTANLDSSYESIKSAHVSDYGRIFNRVALDLDCDPADFELTTDELVGAYRNGSNESTYLEVLLFQYGRYLLISSSRQGSLPANLQGVWNKYNYTPWSGGFWHNINIQMNYWPAFSTNMAEVFEPYMDFVESYMPVLQNGANSLINSNNPSASGQDGGNGWTIGVGLQPFDVGTQWSPGHLGFTTVMFYDYFAFTQNGEILPEMFTLLAEAARYITKTVVEDGEGHLLVHNCESPEQYHNGSLYFTDGTTYTQSLIYENNYKLIRLAEEMGIDINDIDSSDLSANDKAILKTVLTQTDKYDPIKIGLSGQVKEFREETIYGSIGAAQYVHISQLVGLYPGTLINSSTPAWQDAALVSLRGRGDSTEGWGYAHRVNAYARLGEGDYAHDMLHNLIRDSIGNNLWSHYFVYQIDGNEGFTAGVSEMLLQSHEGYIAPLAALPETWANGSYTGLVARGNFVVSAEWADGLAKTFNITSQSGGTASVYYPGISGVRVVRASDGKNVSYTTENGNLISFETAVGETYIISGFTAIEEFEAPDTLTAARANVFADFKLVASPVEGAVKYNLYTAVEDAPTYTLVATSSAGYFTYAPNEGEENARTTFRVTAVNANGVESDGTLCYYNPEDFSVDVLKASGLVVNENLQVVISTNGTAAGYKVYKKESGSTAWAHYSDSDYPLVIITDYDPSATYGVSAISMIGNDESEIKVVNKSAGGSAVVDYDPTNIFKGKQFTAGELATKVHSGYESSVGQTVTYGYDKLTDGSSHSKLGRYSATGSPQVLDAVMDLGSAFYLNELKLEVFANANCGNHLIVELYTDGSWSRVVEYTSNAEIVAKRVGAHIVIDLGGKRAEKIRILIDEMYNNTPLTYYEFLCTGTADENTNPTIDNVFAGKTFTKGEFATSTTTGTHHVGGVDTVVRYDYTKLTDGGFHYQTDRFSTTFSDGAKQKLDAIIDLEVPHLLYDLKLYDFNNTNEGGYVFCGNKLTVEVYTLGEWVEVINWTSYEEIVSHRVSDHILIPLNGVRAEKLRIYISEPYTGPDKNGTVKTQTISFYEFRCSAKEDIYKYEAFDNVFAGKEFVPTSSAASVVHNGANSAYGYPTLTDGKTIGSNVHNGRFSTAGTASNQHLDATLDLGGTYILDQLRIQEFQSGFAGGDLTVQVYANGSWTTVVYLASEAEIKAHSTKASDGIITLDLNEVVAEKVRIYISKKGSSSTISIWEIQCSGKSREVALKVDRAALYEQLSRLPKADRISDLNWNYIYNESFEKFIGYATDLRATQEMIDAYTAEIKAYADAVSSLDLTAYNISFGGDVSMNFRYTAIDAASLANYPDAYIRITIPTRDGSESYNVSVSNLLTDNAGRYVIPVKLNAAQLGDRVELTVVFTDGIEGRTHAYSVRDYADYLLADADYEKSYPGLYDLLRSMLNYGAYAQQYFDYGTDSLANSGIYSDSTDPVLNSEVTVGDRISVIGSADGITADGWSLSLLSMTTARIFFVLDNGENINDYTFTLVKADGTEIALDAYRDGERYRVDVSDIGAAELSDVYTVRVTHGEKSMEVTFTALAYAGTVLGGGTDNAKLINLAKALKLYSDAADAFAAKNA